MKSVLKFGGLSAVLFFAAAGSAFAAGQPLPEPGSIALVGAAVAALVAFSRKGKK